VECVEQDGRYRRARHLKGITERKLREHIVILNQSEGL
jgi:hypothetical protein